MEDNKKKIRMLSNAGFDKDKIKVALGVTDEEIEQALNAPQVEPVKTVERIKKGSGMKPQYTEELWKEGKAMRAHGAKLSEIAEKQGFTMNFVSKMLRRDSYEEVLEYRKADAKKKREAARELSSSRQWNSRKNWRNVDKEEVSHKEEVSPMLIEIRTMNDTLLRIAEALEKKRGLFRK